MIFAVVCPQTQTNVCAVGLPCAGSLLLKNPGSKLTPTPEGCVAPSPPSPPLTSNVLFALQSETRLSELGPACAGSLLTFTDAGLAGKAQRVMAGLSSTTAILSSAATSALLHPEDCGFASYNINLCGQEKVGERLIHNDFTHNIKS
jgi:hypothetical protein